MVCWDKGKQPLDKELVAGLEGFISSVQGLSNKSAVKCEFDSANVMLIITQQKCPVTQALAAFKNPVLYLARC